MLRYVRSIDETCTNLICCTALSNRFVHSVGQSDGGAFYIQEGTATISGCLFQDNLSGDVSLRFYCVSLSRRNMSHEFLFWLGWRCNETWSRHRPDHSRYHLYRKRGWIRRYRGKVLCSWLHHTWMQVCLMLFCQIHSVFRATTFSMTLLRLLIVAKAVVTCFAMHWLRVRPFQQTFPQRHVLVRVPLRAIERFE